MSYCRLLSGLVFLLLTSCSHYQEMVHHMKTQRACESSCLQQYKQCQLTCRNNCQNCTRLANAEAAVHFDRYKKERNIQGEIVGLELQSFRDPLKCRKTTCACNADYGVCVQSCKGRIRKNLQVVPPC